MKATIFPHKIVLSPERERPCQVPLTVSLAKQTRKNQDFIDMVKKSNLQKKKSTWKLSYQTKSKIVTSFASLLFYSKSRRVQMYNGKFIYNFKASFITLTLPSAQRHSDLEIKELLDKFLQALRNRGLKNYVWKAEIQKNQNIHFHLAMDKFFEWFVLRDLWNHHLESLDYVSYYSERFQKLSLSEYAKHRKISIEEASIPYARGKRSGWTKPNTVDCKNIKEGNSLSSYIAKYVSKSSNSDDDDVKRLEAFGRVWGRSQSLSALKFIFHLDDYRLFIKEAKEKARGIVLKTFDYCQVLYLKPRLLSYDLKIIHLAVLHSIAKTFSYPFPVPV